MAFDKTSKTTTFGQLNRSSPFAATLTIYSKTSGRESPTEHLLYKVSNKKAVTMDKKVFVHLLSNHPVTICRVSKK